MQNICVTAANMSADGHAVKTGGVQVKPPDAAYS